MTDHYARLADYNEARSARIRMYVEGIEHLSLDPLDIEAHRELPEYAYQQLSIHYSYVSTAYRTFQTSMFEPAVPASVELPTTHFLIAYWLGHILLNHPLACVSDVAQFVSQLRLSPSSCSSYAQRLIDRGICAKVNDEDDARYARLIPTRTTVRHSVVRELHFMTDIAVTSSISGGIDYTAIWPVASEAKALYQDCLDLYTKYLTDDEVGKLAPKNIGAPLRLVQKK